MKLEANRYFYHGRNVIYYRYYYLNPPCGVKRKLNRPYGVLKVLKPNMLIYIGLSFIIRFYSNLTNRISKTSNND